MGLDMYLYVYKHLSNMYAEQNEMDLFNQIQDLIPETKEFNGEGRLQFATMKIQIAYWRKVNSIHNYFVNYCGNKKDECQEIYVYEEDLRDLLNRIDTVLNEKTANKSKEILPTLSGFFFGSTDYDERYYKDLEYTKGIIEKIFKTFDKDTEFVYQASW